MGIMLVSSQLDWVTITRSTGNTPMFGLAGRNRVEMALAIIESDLGLVAPVRWVPRATSRYYAFTFTDPETKITIDIPHEKDEAQGLRIVAAGSSYLMRSMKGLRSMLLKGWRPTRVDFCWNIQNVDFDIHEIYNRWRAESPKSGILSPDLRGDKAKGETFYIGSRSSDFHVRIYDKAKEKKMQGQQFLRVEFEIKGDLIKEIVERDFDHVDALAAEMSRRAGFFRGLPIVWQVLSDISTEVEQTGEIVVGRKETNREMWFRTQVIPAFAKLNLEAPDAAREIVEILMAQLE